MNVDIIVVGGGMVGATFALALAKQTSLSILVLEASPAVAPFQLDHYHHRVSAISLSSQRLFASLNVWGSIAKTRMSPYTKMSVSEAHSNGAISFDARDISLPVLGWIVENNVIQSALQARVASSSSIKWLAPIKLQSFKVFDDRVEIISEEGESFKARCAVASDGAHSWLRNQAGILTREKKYHEEAMVATVVTEKSHEQTARQVFLPGGPLAFLPLSDPHTSSIVWTMPVSQAKEKMQLSDAAFQEVLSQAFDYQLGSVKCVRDRHTFPLKKQEANQYVKERLALVGDAAHTVHPLLGQGVNVGLLDAASLAEVMARACENHRDFSAMEVLRRYERWRRADNFAMLMGIDKIRMLFASEKEWMKSARVMGLSFTHRASWLKHELVQYALGNRDGLPVLASGWGVTV